MTPEPDRLADAVRSALEWVLVEPPGKVIDRIRAALAAYDAAKEEGR